MKKSKDFAKRVERKPVALSYEIKRKKTDNAVVKLMRDGDWFSVIVDSDIFYKSANELFAVQKYNAI